MALEKDDRIDISIPEDIAERLSEDARTNWAKYTSDLTFPEMDTLLQHMRVAFFRSKEELLRVIIETNSKQSYESATKILKALQYLIPNKE